MCVCDGMLSYVVMFCYVMLRCAVCSELINEELTVLPHTPTVTNRIGGEGKTYQRRIQSLEEKYTFPVRCCDDTCVGVAESHL